MSIQQTGAAETLGLLDDETLNRRIKNEGFSVPCMSSCQVQACTEFLQTRAGPLLFRNGEIIKQSEVTDWNQLRLAREPLCLIKLKRENTIKSCYGGYCGNGYILTALHTFLYTCLYDTYVFFPTTDFVLIYEAELLKESHIISAKDQCLIKLCGQTDVLGKGLEDRFGAPDENNSLYFYTFDIKGNLQRHMCKKDSCSSTRRKRQRNEFLMSTAGQPGESGNPVFSLKSKNCVGIYKGNTKSKKGMASEVDFKQLKAHTTSERADLCCLNIFNGILDVFNKTVYFCWPAMSNQSSTDDPE